MPDATKENDVKEKEKEIDNLDNDITTNDLPTKVPNERIEKQSEELSGTDTIIEENLEAEDNLTAITDESDKRLTTPPNVVGLKNRWWIKYLITAGIVGVFVLLIAWIRNAFTETDPKLLLGYWSDAFSIPGVLLICFGLLVVVSNGGVFDMLSYGLRSALRVFKKDPIDRKYGDFYGYRKARQQKKRGFWFMIIVGTAYLLVGIVLLLLYFNVE